MKNEIGIMLKLTRKQLKLTKVQFSKLAKVGVKAIRKMEAGKSCSIETIAKIRNALKENYNLDLYKISGSRFIWNMEDLDEEGLDIIEGNLLGDGCISKNGVYTQVAKDNKYLKWLSEILSKVGLHCKTIPIKSKTSFSSSGAYYLYSHTCPALLMLRRKWYPKNNNKEIKRVPLDIKITSTMLLHWYLGDGGFHRDARREKYKIGRPSVRLSTDDFLREDIELLINRLKEMGLIFYPSPKLDKEKMKGYVLNLNVNDVFKFFKLTGFEPIKEIKYCITEIRKGRICRFEDKWPKKEDWIKILAKTEGIGGIIKEKRKELGLSQRELAEKIGVKKHQICEIECGRRFTHLKRFERFLEVLKLDIHDTLKKFSSLK